MYQNISESNRWWFTTYGHMYTLVNVIAHSSKPICIYTYQTWPFVYRHIKSVCMYKNIHEHNRWWFATCGQTRTLVNVIADLDKPVCLYTYQLTLSVYRHNKFVCIYKNINEHNRWWFIICRQTYTLVNVMEDPGKPVYIYTYQTCLYTHIISIISM